MRRCFAGAPLAAFPPRPLQHLLSSLAPALHTSIDNQGGSIQPNLPRLPKWLVPGLQHFTWPQSLPFQGAPAAKCCDGLRNKQGY